MATAKYDPTKTASQSDRRRQPRDPERHRRRRPQLRERPGRRLPEHADGGQPARRLLREPRGLRSAQAPGRGRRRLPGTEPHSPYVAGTILDGSAFGGDTALATDWFTKVGAMTWAGNQTVSDGAVIYLLGAREATPSRRPQLASGRRSTGSTSAAATSRASRATSTTSPVSPPACRRTSSPRAGRSSPTPTSAASRSPTTWSRTTAAATAPSGSARPTCPAPTRTSTTRTSGSPTTGSSRTPGRTSPVPSASSPASDGYEVAGNDICGNFSLEYGAGVSVYGLSPNGTIHDNRITLNNSNDEGAGIMIAGAAAGQPRRPVARHRAGRHLRQPDPGQPRQRRRRRHPVPHGRATSR